MITAATLAAGRRLRLLLAEDELLVAMDIEATLRALGYDVVGPVPTVAEVERLAASAELDGAVLDVNLRGVRVFRALPRLLQRGLPVLLSSGYEGAAVLPDEFRHLPILVKPYGAGQLGARLDGLFGSRARA
jgi:CheY-like chemotaxis protein